MGAYSTAVVGTSGLLGYWRLNEVGAATTADDLLGTKDGTYVGSPTLGGTSPVYDGASMLFDASNDQVTLPTTTLASTLGDPVTIEFLAYIATSDLDANYRWMFVFPQTYFTASGTARMALTMGTTGDKTLYWDSSAISGGVFTQRLSADYTPYLDQWTHVAVVANTNFRGIYLNGNATTSAPTSNASYVAIDGGRIGAAASSPTTEFLKGRMSEFAVYNTALSGATISAHYALISSVLPGTPTALTGAGAGSTSATLTWTAPASNGGAALTGYVVTPYIAGVAQTPVSTGSTSASYTITGLTTGTAYTFTVRAVNGNGQGPESASSPTITPLAAANTGYGDGSYGVGSYGVRSTGVTSLSRTAADTVTVTDGVARVVSDARTPSDIVTVTDAATRIAAHPRTVGDTVTVTDGATRVATDSRPVGDTVTVTDAATRAALARARTATDSVTVSDSATGVRVVSRSASDSVTVSDAATRAAVAQARTAADSVTVSDSTAPTSIVATYPHPNRLPSPVTYPSAGNLSVLTGTASDSVSVSDAATRAAIARARSAADSVTVSDTAARAAGHPRSVADTVSVSDVATRAVTTARTPTDTVTVADAATRASLTRARTAADSVAVSDQAARVLSDSRSATDTTTVTDAAVATRGQFRTAADTVTASDTATRLTARTRTVADSVAVTDTASRIVSDARTATDSAAVTDTATRAPAARTRTATDSVSVSDTAVSGGIITRTAADTVSVSDTAARAATARTRTATDATTVADAATRTAAHPGRTAADSVSVTDTASGVRITVRGASDTVSVSDTATRTTITYIRPTADTVAASDQATRVVSLVPRTATDTLTVADAAIGRRTQLRFALDTVSVLDTATALLTPIAPLIGRAVEGGGDLRGSEDAFSHVAGAVDDTQNLALAVSGGGGTTGLIG